MKQIVMLLVCLFLVIGCTKKSEKVVEPIVAEEWSKTTTSATPTETITLTDSVIMGNTNYGYGDTIGLSDGMDILHAHNETNVSHVYIDRSKNE